MFETSVIEGLGKSIDEALLQKHQMSYQCACKGLVEEFSLYESVDFAVSDITFLSFGVDLRYALRGLSSTVKIQRSIEKLFCPRGFTA